MVWHDLIAEEQIAGIIAESARQAILIFKHSTRCGISHMVLDRIERQWRDEEMSSVKPYRIDIIRYRDISAYLAKRFGVEHESPQIIIIRQGESVLNRSHSMINYQEIAAIVRN